MQGPLFKLCSEIEPSLKPKDPGKRLLCQGDLRRDRDGSPRDLLGLHEQLGVAQIAQNARPD